MSWRHLVLVLLLAVAPPLPAQGRVTGLVRGREGVIADAAVFLVPVEREAATRPASDRIDQVDLQFVPRAVVVSPGSTVGFPNSDAVMHNVFHPGRGTAGFDLGTYPRDDTRTFTFSDPGIYVMLCHVHPEMVGYVYVVPSPYRAVTDEEGAFTIADVPAGEYRLHVWHRRVADPDVALGVKAEGSMAGVVLVSAPERKRGRP
ncbi:MAG TPA: plastocyanin/azurin family copper-binding protein [Gemmatimonadaceae bacterium]|nr:plastocyanin/azurin family copper-binding protein [Gemmatimonadaceae bacterium]